MLKFKVFVDNLSYVDLALVSKFKIHDGTLECEWHGR
jgi:hypothetical protein